MDDERRYWPGQFSFFFLYIILSMKATQSLPFSLFLCSISCSFSMEAKVVDWNWSFAVKLLLLNEQILWKLVEEKMLPCGGLWDRTITSVQKRIGELLYVYNGDSSLFSWITKSYSCLCFLLFWAKWYSCLWFLFVWVFSCFFFWIGFIINFDKIIELIIDYPYN